MADRSSHAGQLAMVCDDGPMSERGTRRRPSLVARDAAALIALVLFMAAAACTSGGTDGTAATAPSDGPGSGSLPDTAAGASPTQATAVSTTRSPSTEAAPETGAVAAGDVETGVPGLDSDEIACRSWSRFAGSFQVVAVAATFGEGGSIEAAALEVMASPVVTSSYLEFVDNVPDEVVEESELVARNFLGPYARRSERALTALRNAGADDEMVELIAGAWLDALAQRDPMLPVLEVVLPRDVEAVVQAAASDFDAQLVPIPLDPSLVSEVEVPLTERYLSDNCPDGGALAGSEVQG
jgi:hypothetical protein